MARSARAAGAAVHGPIDQGDFLKALGLELRAQALTSRAGVAQAAVLALCARYPKQLARLEATWWRDRARTEQLAALAAWRGAIDHAGQDPREELAFHAQLADLGYLLEHLPGGADTFQPGPPPHEWLDPTQH